MSKHIKWLASRFSIESKGTERVISSRDFEQEMMIKELEGGGFIACRNRAIDIYRKEKRIPLPVALDPDFIPTGTETDIHLRLKQFVTALTSQEAYVLENLIKGYNKREIARALKTSPSSITRVLKRIKRKYEEYI